MKKIIIIITIIITITKLNAQKKIESVFSFEGGYINQSYSLITDGSLMNFSTKNPSFYTDLVVGAKIIKKYYITGGFNTCFTPNSLTSYSPYVASYLFKIFYKKNKIEAGYSHGCIHPIFNKINDNRYPVLLRASEDKFYFKYSIND